MNGDYGLYLLLGWVLLLGGWLSLAGGAFTLAVILFAGSLVFNCSCIWEIWKVLSGK